MEEWRLRSQEIFKKGTNPRPVGRMMGGKMFLPEIIATCLKDHGYEGLCCDECGCGIDDLIPCGEYENLKDCEPAYQVPGCSDSCGKGCDFHWSLKKPETTTP